MISLFRRLSASPVWLCLAIVFSTRAASAGPLVAPTEALPPEEQVKKFHLPPGFEIQLVASEPDIQKPMNLNFDSRGRLWVSHSKEYPFAAKDSQVARDAITILDGIGADGRATKISRFADKLNIPIGVLPLYDGTEALAWSVPYLWKLRDTDGDGVADQREIMFGAYDFVDTHGNQNSLKMGMDGWIYACHGFRNDSKIRMKGEGEVVLHLQSGNTYRFKPDGSKIEQYSWGQVNPFGSCFDPNGNFFTADCHSKPVSLVLRDGVIESFGKPHDGLGFTPAITGNDHGSTGIAGIVWYDAPQFPAEYRHNIFVGNVVTNRVHRDMPEWRGSSPWIEKPEDFLVCDDWWFHPVDLQVGPDGALYIADFYNCIIGHYEVDINHPRRDRHRGRIWRVVWKGLDDARKSNPAPFVDLAALKSAELIDKLGDTNLNLRRTATNELTRRPDFAVALRTRLGRPVGDSRQGVQLIWACVRAGQLPPEEFLMPVWSEPVVRANWLRAMTDWPNWTDALFVKVRGLLTDEDPQVRRIAAEALGQHPRLDNVSALMKAWSAAPAEDALLVHAVRISLRNQLRAEKETERLTALKLSDAELAKLVEITLAVPTEAAAWFTFEFVRKHDVDPDLLTRCLAHVARNVGESRLNETVAFVQSKYRDDLRPQLGLFQPLYVGLTERGKKIDPNSPLGKWGASLARAVLDPQRQPKPAWTVHPLSNTGNAAFQNPWGVRIRGCTDGQQDVLFFDSIVNGENLTGILRSNPFAIPENLSFWLCGHNGLPGTNPEPVNHVRLKLVEGGEVIARQTPPRHDTAQKVTWDLKNWKGKQGILEVVDADAGPSYAWLGVSRFDPAVVAQPTADFLMPDQERTLAVRLVEQLKLADLLPTVVAFLADQNGGVPLRIVAAQAILRIDAGAARSELEQVVTNTAEPASLRAVVGQVLGTVNSDSARAALTAAIVGAPSSLEQSLALSLVGTGEGADALLASIAAGKASPRLLQDPPVVDRLKPRLNPAREARIAELTSRLAPADERIRKLVAKRMADHAGSGATAEKGAALFKTHCSACHKIGEVGFKVGPQLDGIGQRGPERLLEDILDPNRNVDGAFRATIVATTGGQIITGLRLRDEGQIVVLVDTQGKEQRIPMAEIEESQISPISPMPSNFAEVIPEADLHHLLAFLLTQKTAPPREAGQ
jgi:putative heme-binding domain-containing protein